MKKQQKPKQACEGQSIKYSRLACVKKNIQVSRLNFNATEESLTSRIKGVPSPKSAYLTAAIMPDDSSKCNVNYNTDLSTKEGRGNEAQINFSTLALSCISPISVDDNFKKTC